MSYQDFACEAMPLALSYSPTLDATIPGWPHEGPVEGLH